MTIPDALKIKFPDPDEHEQKVNLYKEIWQTLIDLRETLPNPRDRDVVLRFSDCINGGELPYLSDRPTAKQSSKSACLFSLISWMIQVYWMFCEGDETGGHEVGVRTYLLQLQEITTNGINNYKVTGNPVDGYSLGER